MRVRLHLPATALALLLSAQLASDPAAALTADEAWAAFQAAAAESGATVSAGGTARNGDTLTVTGVSMSFAAPEGLAMVSTLPSLAFRDRGDGSVEVIYPPAYDTAITLPDGEDPDAPKTFTLSSVLDGVSVVASGEAAAPAFAVTAKSVAATAKDFKDRSGKPLDLSAVISVSNLAGNWATPAAGAGATGMAYDSRLTAATLAIQGEGRDPVQNMAVSGTISATALEVSGKALMGDPIQMQTNLAAALAGGVMFDGKVSTGGLSVILKIDEAGKQSGLDATLAGLSAHAFLDKTLLDYGFVLTGGNVAMRGMDMPFPEVGSTFGEIALGFAIPVSASDQPQDFKAMARFVDLTLAEPIWAMFDPTQRLRRDPVSAILDLKGTGSWTVDILDPATKLDEMPELPAKLFSLDVNEVLLRAAGAQIAGKGALTFDNAHLEPIASFPAPDGKINFTLTGINALIEALVSLGFVPEDQLMSVRMGLAMMTRPGAGPDELVSEVEFRKGILFVNGQQLQ